ncbi:lytic murein transglycosylase B [Parahaliea sp. F7430]|uniref:Lytic murein transglycosylase B n=1 Tax=Sediminihaliea albiluteola TaxID=2758564 RepID=A0A7W2YJL9_9GAMM|nr:lytic murein transglycosylase B [Sediminihaliea albiluteola]MBA6413212.1 lytic murein transglycosylase B [Sediminihaliea albiluteola]
MLRKLRLALAAALLSPAVAMAATNYAAHPEALALIDELVTEQGYDRAQLQAVFANAERQEKILEAISRPAEKVKPWYEYRQIFLTEKREQQGREFLALHRETLDRAERETGVPAEIIVAIIGVETYYGRITGNYRVIDALSTLAFDYPRRSTFFRKELKNYLQLTHEQGFDPLSMTGSYAGAMGYGQFMPSSYCAYAVDFDQDGQTDIWNNPVDAIGSVANYFKRHGWRAGESVVSAARSNGKVPADWFNDGLKPERKVADYVAAGLTPVMALDPEAQATAMQFDSGDGFEYWLGLHNFYVITRYNHSAMYAMSVYQLSQRLAMEPKS